jgi:hypothetical protein
MSCATMATAPREQWGLHTVHRLVVTGQLRSDECGVGSGFILQFPYIRLRIENCYSRGCHTAHRTQDPSNTRMTHLTARQTRVESESVPVSTHARMAAG